MRKEYESLSKKYRDSKTPRLATEEIEAYMEARFPATYAVCYKVLTELEEMLLKEGREITHFLDIGSGPGTGSMAACAIFKKLEEVILIEKDPRMLKKAQEKIQEAGFRTRALYQVADPCSLERKGDFKADLALFSYALGEMADKIVEAISWAILQAPFCLIIEPGTPRGFATILKARDHFLKQGFHIIAPCPHAYTCPLLGKETQNWGWCHFGTKVERSMRHRHIKGASLGWEEEKYCYLAVTSLPRLKKEEKRLLRPLKKSPGKVTALWCTSSGEAKEEIVFKRDKEEYKATLKVKWGEKRCFEDQL